MEDGVKDAPQPHLPVNLGGALDWIATLYGVDPEDQLWFSVLELAVTDAVGFAPNASNSFFSCEALYYLKQAEIPACVLCGVNSEVVRRLLRHATLIPV